MSHLRLVDHKYQEETTPSIAELQPLLSLMDERSHAPEMIHMLTKPKPPRVTINTTI